MGPIEQAVELLRQAVENLITAFLGGLLGVLVSKPVLTRWMRWRWGGWEVEVTQQGELLTREPLTPEEARIVVSPGGSRRRKSVHLKGVISGIGHRIGEDPASDRAHEVGLTVINHASRRVQINLDRDPGPHRRGSHTETIVATRRAPAPGPLPTGDQPQPPAENGVEAAGPSR